MGNTKLAPRRIIEAGLWLVAVGVPLAWSDKFYAEYVLPKLVVLTAGLLIAAGGCVFAVLRGERVIRRTGLEWPILVLGGALALSCARSVDPISSALGHYNDYTHGLWPLLLLAALSWLAAWGGSGGMRRRVLTVSVATAVLVAAYAVLQALGVEIFARAGDIIAGRAVSFIGNAVFLGAYLAVVLPVALHFAVTADGKARVWAVFGFLGIGAGIVATTSRGALLAAVCAGAAYLIMSRRLKMPKLSRPQLLAAAAAALVISSMAGVRFMSRDTTRANQARIALWEIGWKAFREKPLLGSGPDTFEWGFRRHRTESYIRARRPKEYMTHAHNDLLQALSTLGVLGFAAYLFAVLSLALFGWRRLRREGGREGADPALLAALLALFIVMKFNPPYIAALTLAALYLGLLCADEDGERRPIDAGGMRFAIAGAFLLFTAGSVWLSCRLAGADWYFKRALVNEALDRPDYALAHYRKAARLNRCELRYRMKMVNHLLSLASRLPAGSRRSALIDELAASAREAKACRPQSMHAYHIDGIVELAQVQSGRAERLTNAQAALDRGLQLDPLNAALLRARGKAAYFGGDMQAAQLFARRAQRLETLR
ncbi:MAG: O-antigen ligase family protein [Elusimicrobiota bacterium]